VLIDHTNGRVLDVLESREKEGVVRWLKAGKESGLLSALEEVTCDMWDAYAEAPREVFGPTIRITIDRFHVMKNFQDRLNEARRELQTRLDKEQAKQLKGSRWLWVTNPENLTAGQRAALEVSEAEIPGSGATGRPPRSVAADFRGQTDHDTRDGHGAAEAVVPTRRTTGA